jgi:hypothetical protein
MARSLTVSSSRAYRADVQRAFALTMPIDLSLIFKRVGVFPAIDGVRGQEGAWSTTGQTRTVLLADGSTIDERLTAVTPGKSFGYALTNITGAFRLLVSTIDGRWDFAPAPGGGSTVTWSWRLHPRNAATLPALLVVGALWRPYARKALDELAATLDP